VTLLIPTNVTRSRLLAQFDSTHFDSVLEGRIGLGFGY
jgi:hypothetical protein